MTRAITVNTTAQQLLNDAYYEVTTDWRSIEEALQAARLLRHAMQYLQRVGD
jgi:hypothetical protein